MLGRRFLGVGGIARDREPQAPAGGCLAPLPPPGARGPRRTTFLSSLNFPICEVGLFALHSGGRHEMLPTR